MDLRFDRGTIVVEAGSGEPDPTALPDVLWDGRVGCFRAPAHRWPALVRALAELESGPRRRLRLQRVRHVAATVPSLRDYQLRALAAWRLAGHRGLVALPTGSGKTRIALAAIATLGRPALVLVPTRALLAQWAAALRTLEAGPVGCYGDGERSLRPLTVATFESALRHMDAFGDCFPLLVVDEVHHFGTGARAEALECCAAPARLGLTATPPEDPNEAARLDALVGPVVEQRRVRELTGGALAPYEHVVHRIELDADERATYEQGYEPWLRARRMLQRERPDADGRELSRLLAGTGEGRRLLAGHRDAQRVVANARAKRDLAARLLAEHPGERVLLFTADNEAAYAVSTRLLVPAVTSDLGRAERAALLERFRDGRVRALVSTRVLNEGVDVPDAAVAIVLGGRMGRREQVQRIGRVLRPRPGKRAVVHEVIARRTFEEHQTKRRSLRRAA